MSAFFENDFGGLSSALDEKNSRLNPSRKESATLGDRPRLHWQNGKRNRTGKFRRIAGEGEPVAGGCIFRAPAELVAHFPGDGHRWKSRRHQESVHGA